MHLPNYKDLPIIPGSEERHAWDVWGRADSLGALNKIAPSDVVAAATLVVDGVRISLDLPLGEPNPGLFPERQSVRRTEFVQTTGRDDKLDDFYLQSSTQWDGFKHIKSFSGQYWTGLDDHQLDEAGRLGVDHWAAEGVIGRGILIDIAGHGLRRGKPVNPETRFAIEPELVTEVSRDQGVEIRRGDILLLRTGWLEWFQSLKEEQRAELRGTVGTTFACPGLASSRHTAQFLWDSGIAAVAADNPALEALPVRPGRAEGFLHRRLLPLLGIPIGEFWDLQTLARECRERQRWEFMVTSAPLRVPGAAGTPANAYAIL